MKLQFHWGQSGKGNNHVNPQWFGYCWGFWLPRLKWNKGLPLRDRCVDISIMWLCFWVGIILYS